MMVVSIQAINGTSGGKIIKLQCHCNTQNISKVERKKKLKKKPKPIWPKGHPTWSPSHFLSFFSFPPLKYFGALQPYFSTPSNSAY